MHLDLPEIKLIPAKSPDAGGCVLTTLAVKSSRNRGPGEGLKSGSYIIFFFTTDMLNRANKEKN